MKCATKASVSPSNWEVAIAYVKQAKKHSTLGLYENTNYNVGIATIHHRRTSNKYQTLHLSFTPRSNTEVDVYVG